MDCDNPNANNELKQACACQKAVNEFAKSYETYQSQIADYNSAKDKYTNVDWPKYQVDLSAWESRKAAKRNELVNETRVWNNCVLWTNVYGHDDWCQGNTGFGKQVGAGGYGCIGGQGKGLCGRTDVQVNEALNEWVGLNPPPSPPSGGSNGVFAPCTTCSPPVGNNVLCCSTIIDDITAGKNVSINAVTQCAQNLVEAAKNSSASPVVPTTPVIPVTPAPMDTIQAPPQTPPPEPSDPSGVPPTDDNNDNANNSNDLLNILLIIIIFIVVLSCISSLFSVMFR